MTTELQIAANRQNALRSTGPTSPAGKAATRLNGLTHGAYAVFCAIESLMRQRALRDAKFPGQRDDFSAFPRPSPPPSA